MTDEFIKYIRNLQERGGEWALDEASEFLVIAATLLDIKAARLLPAGEVEDDEDMALLEPGTCSSPGSCSTRPSSMWRASWARACTRKPCAFPGRLP